MVLFLVVVVVTAADCARMDSGVFLTGLVWGRVTAFSGDFGLRVIVIGASSCGALGFITIVFGVIGRVVGVSGDCVGFPLLTVFSGDFELRLVGVLEAGDVPLIVWGEAGRLVIRSGEKLFCGEDDRLVGWARLSFVTDSYLVVNATLSTTDFRSEFSVCDFLWAAGLRSGLGTGDLF